MSLERAVVSMVHTFKKAYNGSFSPEYDKQLAAILRGHLERTIFNSIRGLPGLSQIEVIDLFHDGIMTEEGVRTDLILTRKGFIHEQYKSEYSPSTIITNRPRD